MKTVSLFTFVFVFAAFVLIAAECEPFSLNNGPLCLNPGAPWCNPTETVEPPTITAEPPTSTPIVIPVQSAMDRVRYLCDRNPFYSLTYEYQSIESSATSSSSPYIHEMATFYCNSEGVLAGAYTVPPMLILPFSGAQSTNGSQMVPADPNGGYAAHEMDWVCDITGTDIFSIHCKIKYIPALVIGGNSWGDADVQYVFDPDIGVTYTQTINQCSNGDYSKDVDTIQDASKQVPFDESRVRYIIADIQLGRPEGYYMAYPNDLSAVEAVKRWNAGVRVTNISELKRKFLPKYGSYFVVWVNSSQDFPDVNGMDINLSN